MKKLRPNSKMGVKGWVFWIRVLIPYLPWGAFGPQVMIGVVTTRGLAAIAHIEISVNLSEGAFSAVGVRCQRVVVCFEHVNIVASVGLAFECDDTTRRAHVSRSRISGATGFRIGGSLLGCLALPLPRREEDAAAAHQRPERMLVENGVGGSYLYLLVSSTSRLMQQESSSSIAPGL